MNLAEFKKLHIPDTPGVYTFKQNKGVLYIGKATSLRERLRSYFNDDLIATRGRLLVDMIFKADTIEFEQTDSVLEAFIRETELIKKYQPPYNTKDKDNKSFNYVVITDEEFPRVLTIRGRNLEQNLSAEETTNEPSEYKFKYIFGPYPFGTELREALKIVRKIFPYRDTCIPAHISLQSGNAHVNTVNIRNTAPAKPCFNRTLGLCPGVCTGEISASDYAKTIQNIRLFFTGKKSAVLKDLHKRMLDFAKEQKFEKASEIKKTIFALEHIKDVSMIKRDRDQKAMSVAQKDAYSATQGTTDHATGTGLNTEDKQMVIGGDLLASISLSKKKKLKKDIVGIRAIAQDWQGQEAKRQFRVESYDIAHMSGKDMVGVMVVSTDGEFDKSQYRKFIINDIDASNDTGALRQVLDRRFAHMDWKWPDIIVVDGGEAQLSATMLAVRENFEKITSNYPELNRLVLPHVVSVVKDASHNAREILNFSKNDEVSFAGNISKEHIISLNAETHRFAITFHKKKRSDSFLPSDANSKKSKKVK